MNATPTGVTPSCDTCPAMLLARDVPSKFRRSVGSAVCGRFGTPLDRPGATDLTVIRKQHEYFASKCGSYGEPMPAQPVEDRFLVALPDPTVMRPSDDDVKRDACTSCAMCSKYVRDDAVAENMGWTSGMCSAKGKLILTNRQVYEARDCEYREAGTPRRDTRGMVLFPEYEDDFGSFDPVKAFLAGVENQVDPAEYPTDMPVSDEDAEEGIRAWRKIEDPESGNHTYLPVFRRDFFSDEEAALIPMTGDPEHPELYVDHFRGVYLAAVCWSELDETPALNGEAGTGKTELFRHLAWLMCAPFRRLSITGSTELDDLAGKMRYSKDRGTYFQYGRLPIAWTHPGVICIDEPNTGPPDVWQFLRPLTDNSKQLVLDVNEGEVIKRHDSAYLGMAMNPAWDVRNVGTQEISDADANRLFHVYVELPPEKLEREIIKARVKLDGWEIDEDRLDMVMSIAKDLRALAKEGTIGVSWAIRPQIKVARALRWFDTVTAYRRAIADFLEPDAQQALLDAVKAHAR